MKKESKRIYSYGYRITKKSKKKKKKKKKHEKDVSPVVERTWKINISTISKTEE